MKRLLAIVVLSLSCLLSYGQTKEEAKSQVKIVIQMVNEYLPQSLGIMSFDKMTVDGDDLFAYITINEEQLDFDEYISNINVSKSSAAAMVVGENEELGNLLRLSELNLVYVVKGSASGREERIYISSDDFANASDKETVLNDMIIQTVYETRKELPQDFGSGMMLTAVYLEDGYFCYEVMTDESVTSIQSLKTVKSMGTSMEESLLEAFASTDDPMEKIFLKYIRDSKIGIRYVFWSEDSPERVSFSLTSEMLSNVLDGGFPFVE